MTSTKQKKQKVFYLIMFGFVFLICSSIAYLTFSFYAQNIFNLAAKHTVSDTKRTYMGKGRVFADDLRLGYKYNPGVYAFNWFHQDLHKNHTYEVTIGQDGYRTTSKYSNYSSNLPEIWIFGGSFTMGPGLNDQEVFPSIIQRNFPNFRVRNFGVEGYGNIHALIQLKELVKRKNNEKKLIIGVFAYNSFHLRRNVAAPSRMSAFMGRQWI